MTELQLVTSNEGKLREFRQLLAGAGVLVQALSLEVEESGATYQENALLKVAIGAASSSRPVLADDSGLELAALSGYPGIHSARIAPTDQERRALVLAKLAEKSVPRPWEARFVCVLALLFPGSAPQLFRGELEGELVPEERGVGGFGYDPIFLPKGSTRTLAEVPEEEKNQMSHRGRALTALLRSGALSGDAARKNHRRY